MANQYRDIDTGELIALAEKYIDECEAEVKEVATGKGVHEVKERKLPTMKYFVLQWLKKQGFDFYTRQHVYKAIANEAHPLCVTLKNIREVIDAVAEDIVANEGKGIFYAKNRLGMTDKNESKNDTTYRLVDDTTDSTNTNTDTTQGAAEGS
jgi:hypothetical protein